MEHKPKDIWEKIGDRVRNEIPQAYQDANWNEMAGLLEESKLNNGRWNNLLGFSIGILVLAGLLIWINFPSPLSLEQPKEVETYSSTRESYPVPNSGSISSATEKQDLEDGNFLNENTNEKSDTGLKGTLAKRKEQIGARKQIEGQEPAIGWGKTGPQKKIGDYNQWEVEGLSNNGNELSNTIGKNILWDSKKNTIALDEKRVLLTPVEMIPLLREPIKSKIEDLDSKVIIKPRKDKKFGYGIIAGLNVGAIDQRGRFSFRPLGGLFLSYKVNDRWSLQLEAYHKNVKGYDQSNTITDLSYGSNGMPSGRISYTRSFNTLNWIELSLLAKRKFGKSMNLNLGGRISYAYSHLGSFSIIISGGGNLLFTRSGLSLPKSFWRTNYAVVVGVEKRISYRWSAGLQSNLGLLDITPDNLYNEKVNHLNSDLQLTIRYHIK